MASSAETSKAETSATTEDEEGKDIIEEEDEDKQNDEATKSGRFSVEKSKVTPSGDTSKSPGTGKTTPASRQKSSGTRDTKSGIATTRSTVKTHQEASTETPPSTSIRTPTYITIPQSTAGTPTFVYFVPNPESGETSTAGSHLTSAISHITKGTLSATVSDAITSKLTSTLQSTCESAQRSICAAISKKEGLLEEPECPPSMEECYEEIRDWVCDALTYENICHLWKKVWDGFLIMGGGYSTEKVKACKD